MSWRAIVILAIVAAAALYAIAFLPMDPWWHRGP